MQTITRETETRLSDTVSEIAADIINWRCVHFAFDRLMEQYRSDYQIQIAVNLVGDLLFSQAGGIYVCRDRTILVLCRQTPPSQLEKMIFQLRYLFMDDPLAYLSNGDENPDFCRLYDLAVEAEAFQQLVRKKLTLFNRMTMADPAPEPNRQPPAPGVAQGAAQSALTPARLAHIEHDLNKADLSRIMRRQPVCALIRGQEARRIFDEHYIHIAHLKQMLRMELDFFSNRALFRYLTQLLDERMLDLMMMSPMRFFETPASFNFNIESILSARFREFDSLTRPNFKVSIIIELQAGDVFGDITAFHAARNLLERLDYKLCLDGINPLLLPHIDRAKLGFDLMKLQWNSDTEQDLTSENNAALIAAIRECGANRMILCRCDSRQAVAYGQALGIQLFQGRFIDRLLNPHQKTGN